MEVTRDNAWATLTRYTTSESLLRHALAVEASTRWYARQFGEDEELWGCTALLHDFDYEIHPTLDKHPQDGAPILRDEGYPEVVIEAVLSHAEHLAIPRDTLLMRTLFACDELSGFVHACGLVRPTGLEGLEPKSVRKKLKQPSFAAGVHRDEVYAGAELLGLELDEHIANVVAALQPIAGELGPARPCERLERRPDRRASVARRRGVRRTPLTAAVTEARQAFRVVRPGAPVAGRSRGSLALGRPPRCGRRPRAPTRRRARRRRTTPSHGPERPRTPSSRTCGTGRGSLPCSETAARLPVEGRLVVDHEIRPVRGRRGPRASRRLTAGVAVAHDHVSHRAVDRRSERPRRGRRPRVSRGQRRQQPVEIAVGRPPAARDADQPGAGDLAHVHTLRVEHLDERRRISRARETRRASSTGSGLTTSTRVASSARQRSATAAAWSKAHAGRVSIAASRPARDDVGHQFGSKRAAPGRGSKLPSGSYAACEK